MATWLMVDRTGAMMNSERISDSPASTWFGGTVWVPRALRVSESTMNTRGNPVIRISTEGATASTVRTIMMRTDVEGFFSPLMLTLTFEPAAIRAGVMVGLQRAGCLATACALPVECPD